MGFQEPQEDRERDSSRLSSEEAYLAIPPPHLTGEVNPSARADAKTGDSREDCTVSSVGRQSTDGRTWPACLATVGSLLFFLGLLLGPLHTSIPLAGTVLGSLRAGQAASPKNLDPLPSPPAPLEVPLPPDDAALFDRALKVASKSRAENPKIAFMFLTRGPLPLAPLWARFFAGHEEKFSIYIHTSGLYQYGPNDLPPVFQGRQIPSKSTSWGSINLVDAERRLLAHAFMDPDNEHFVLVSESCIALQPFPRVYQYLTESSLSFVQVVRPEGDLKCWSESMLPTVPYADWVKGSQWVHVRRAQVPIILQDKEYYHAFATNDLKSAYSDEHYLPTMLHKMVPADIANRSLTWFHFPKKPSESRFGQPWHFEQEDVTWGLLRRLRWGRRCSDAPIYGSPCFLFARKFRESALSKLMELSWILGY